MQRAGIGAVATNESKRMIAEQDCSEPDWENYEPDSYCEPDEEDFAYMIAQEREVASLRSEYHGADRQLRNYHKHTDRQLRALSKEKKDCARNLARAHQFDVVTDSFDVEIADDVWDTLPWPYDEGEDVSDKAPRVLTRKDKRLVAPRNMSNSRC